MFITKEEIKKELKDEDCWKELKPKEREMFLRYCTNGHEEVEAFKDVYCTEDAERKVRFPAKKAAEIMAKEAFNECFEIYADLLQEFAATRTNAHLYNNYLIIATANILDYTDNIGQFKFKDIEEARERLGAKALAIEKLELTAHPRDPNSTITVPKLYDKFKAMKELAKFSKFYGEEAGGGAGLGDISISSHLATVTKFDDEKNRQRLGVNE